MPIVFFHLHAYQIFIQINEFSYNENVTFRIVYMLRPMITEDLETICLILSHFQLWTFEPQRFTRMFILVNISYSAPGLLTKAYVH